MNFKSWENAKTLSNFKTNFAKKTNSDNQFKHKIMI